MITLFCLAGLLWIAAGMGRVVLDRIGVEFNSSVEGWVFYSGIGYGLLSFSVFVLASIQALSRFSVWLVLAVWTVTVLIDWRSRPPSTQILSASRNRIDGIDRVSLCVLGIFITAGVLLVLTPAIGNDALSYHLAVPKLYLKYGGFYSIQGNIFSNYPLNSELLYLVGLVMDGDSTAKGIHFLFTILLLIAMSQFVRNHLKIDHGKWLSLLVFFSIPSVLITACLAYSDLTYSLYVFLSVYAFVNWYANRQNNWLAICGALTGLAMSTKYAGLLLPLMGILGILWACNRRQTETRQAFHLMLIFGACVVIIGSPYYLKNMFLTGNPLYPFFVKWFGGVDWDSVQSRRYDLFHHALGMGRRPIDYILLPWNVSIHAKMNSPQFDGIVGPLFILTIPFALCLKNVHSALKISLIGSGIIFVFWAVTIQQIRYLIPIFPFLSILVAYCFAYYRQKRWPFGLLVLFILVCTGFNGYHIVQEVQRINPFSVLTGKESQEEFYRRHIPSYDMYHTINTLLPKNSKIFLIYMKNLGYLIDRPFYSDSIFESYTLEKILSNSKTPDAVHQVMVARGFTHILYDARYVFDTQSTLTPEQQALFRSFQQRYLTSVKIDGSRYFLFKVKA